MTRLNKYIVAMFFPCIADFIHLPALVIIPAVKTYFHFHADYFGFVNTCSL